MDFRGDKCVPCPKGSFSYLHGSTECTVCPGKSTTTIEGASMESDCKGKRNTLLTVKLYLVKIGKFDDSVFLRKRTDVDFVFNNHRVCIHGI